MNASSVGGFRCFVNHALPMCAFFSELHLHRLFARGLFRRIIAINFDLGELAPKRTYLTSHLRFCAGLVLNKARFEALRPKFYGANTGLAI